MSGGERFRVVYEDDHWALYEFDGEQPIRLVGADGGEPEDQLLVRDWKWVAVELNKLAAEAAALRQPAQPPPEAGPEPEFTHGQLVHLAVANAIGRIAAFAEPPR